MHKEWYKQIKVLLPLFTKCNEHKHQNLQPQGHTKTRLLTNPQIFN